MSHHFFTKVSAVLVLLITLTTVAAPSYTISANDGHDEQLHGTFVASNQVPNCTSPVGICLAGNTYGDLKGQISGQLTSVTTITRGNQTFYRLDGYFDISTDHGTMHGSATFLDTVQNTGIGTLTITSGTGVYDGAKGIFGLAQPVPPDASGTFTFYYEGSLQLHDNHH